MFANGVAQAFPHGLEERFGLLPTAMHKALYEVTGTKHQSKIDQLDMQFDHKSGIYWSFMQPEGRPCFNMNLLRQMVSMQQQVRTLCARQSGSEHPLRYFVLGSRTPGIFNLGGDLGLFAEKIRARDTDLMHRYAHACIDVVHANSQAFDLPIITMALIQGDALGGGLECALSLDLIVAERSAKLGLPEILFNLFPGMGAYSFLSRRMDASRAEKLILSGRVYSAEELHEMGVVDVLAEDGQGVAAVHDYVDRHGRKHNAHHAVYRVRRAVRPVPEAELRRVVDIWVDAALSLTEADLRKMQRLTVAQERRLQNCRPPQVLAAE